MKAASDLASEPYRIIVQPGVHKDVKTVHKTALGRILKRIEALAGNPRPRGCKKISDPDIYRVRQGDYRVVYQVDDSTRTVTVFKIGHRREIYR